MMSEAATRSPRIRVLIVAGNDLFRSGLAALLAKEPDIEVQRLRTAARAWNWHPNCGQTWRS
jgi:DNA-binding NarL/FixJ family response regulator